MKKQGVLNSLLNIVVVCLIIFGVSSISIPVIAKEIKYYVKGTVYETSDDAEYSLSDGDKSTSIPLGSLTLNGNCKASSNAIRGFETYNATGNLDNDVITISYSFPNSRLKGDEDEWLVTEDTLKTIEDFELNDKIKYGVLVFQSSFDGNTWITDYEITNFFSKNNTSFEYKVTSNQLLNGCYYRVIVAYRMRKLASTGLFGYKDYWYKRTAEVYQFYICNEQENKNAVKPKKGSTYAFTADPINTGMDNGYSGNTPITANDPHYTWNIGQFYMSGYSGNPITERNDNPVFLKNVGDKVVLWFDLQQDINELNNKPNLSINNDKNGSDQYFSTPVQNFKRGALIIRFTDYQNKKQTNTYVDYLAAASTTTADTKVQVFEEGDYEVALDYEIVDSPKIIGNIPGIRTYTSYRMYFKFSVRNSNCMVYPIDLETGRELKGNTFTEKGFRLDLAKSRYLDISIKRGILNKNDLDLRESQIASDQEEFTDEGVYQFIVNNKYRKDSVTKFIYVGSNNLLKAYVIENPKYSIADLVELEEQGAIFQDDGSIVFPADEQETIVDNENRDGDTPTSNEGISEEEGSELEEKETIKQSIIDKLFKRKSRDNAQEKEKTGDD